MVLVTAVAGLSAGIEARGALIVRSGTFAGPNPFRSDAALVATYRDLGAQVAAGTLVSRSLFSVSEISIPDEPPYEGGNSVYHVTTFDGLQAGDIVRTTEVLESRTSASDPWVAYQNVTQFVQVGPYTHSAANTVSNWRDFIVDQGGGAFRFVKGTGQFWYVLPGDDIVGYELRLLRQYEVLRGATLTNARLNSRGLTIGDAATGGQSLLGASYNPVARVVPEPASIASLALGAALAGLAARRARSRA
jgi:hypothetical protein